MVNLSLEMAKSVFILVLESKFGGFEAVRYLLVWGLGVYLGPNRMNNVIVVWVIQQPSLESELLMEGDIYYHSIQSYGAVVKFYTGEVSDIIRWRF